MAKNKKKQKLTNNPPSPKKLDMNINNFKVVNPKQINIKILPIKCNCKNSYYDITGKCLKCKLEY